jgi:hypothetical protein
MSDAWALGLNGQQAATDALDLVMATPADADPQVLSQGRRVLTAIDGMYDGMPADRPRSASWPSPACRRCWQQGRLDRQGRRADPGRHPAGELITAWALWATRA